MPVKNHAASWQEIRYRCGMKRIYAWLSAALLLLSTSADAARPDPEAQNLTILVDEAMLLPMAELARVYSTTQRMPLSVVRASNDPALLIEEGYDAHVLLSADPTLIERLAQRGLIDVFGTKAFATTQLALVVPTRLESKLGLSRHISFANVLFRQKDYPIFATAPDTQSGVRAQALLQDSRFSYEMTARMQVQPSQAAMLEKLTKTDGFALMLASSAINEDAVAIVNVLPPDLSAPVRYDAVVLASEAMDRARAFTAFLQSETAVDILRRYGYQTPQPDSR